MKRRIVLLGPPASGKGTQAELISAKFGIPTTSPGAILREERKAGTALGLEAERYTSKGRLIPDELIAGLINSWLEDHDGEFVFDGVPRSLGQAEALETVLNERNRPLDVVIALEADLETLKSRVASRVMCADCGRIFSVGLHVVSASDRCPNCGGHLIRRSDDTPETLAARLEEYSEKTEPLIAYYEQKELLRRVNSGLKPDLVFESIRAILEGE
ncbi:adenylate kinase family protein [Verrucomicrobiota bacterium sgz303538]